MKMNIKPAFKYMFSNFLKGAAVVYLVLFIILAMFMVIPLFISPGSSTVTSFTGYGITLAIFMFVMGISSIRSDLRLCLQYGVSRRTAFVSELLVILSASVIMAAAGEILTGIAQVLSMGNSKFYIADLYQLIFAGPNIPSLSFSQHVLSALFSTSIIFCACLSGMFLSLLFWRLNKIWTVIVAIAIPVLINSVPIFLYKLGVNLKPFVSWITSSPLCFILFFLLLAALFGIIDWLLLQRANIREAK